MAQRKNAISIRLYDEELNQVNQLRCRLGQKNNSVMIRKLILILAADERFDFLLDAGNITTPTSFRDFKMELALEECVEIMFDMLKKQGFIK